MALICGHDAPAYGLPLCEHIRTATAVPLDHYVHYTGRGVERQRICGICRHEAATAVSAAVCEVCFDATEGSSLGVLGRPQAIDASRPVPGMVQTTQLPAEAGPVLDIAPTEHGFLLLCDDGRILRWDTDAQTCAEAARSTVTVPADAKPWGGHEQGLRLHASRDGAFAAVVVDHGRTGEVIDLSTGAVTLSLENDGYYSHTVPFSLAFVEHAGRTVVLHRKVWSVIEAVDAATGAQVSRIPMTEAHTAWAGYFHGALHLSPAGTRIASDAWWWQPVGRPFAWSLERWLTQGEDAWTEGTDRWELPGCDDHWNRPVAWLDEEHLVLGGLGDDEQELVPGARVFLLGRESGESTLREIATFGGPDGRFFASDGLLFSSSQAGLEIWDPTSGSRLGRLAGFRPTHHDLARRELVELSAIGLRRWSTAHVER
ncbi:hypothetical protein NRK68_30270 [Streptomyces yangpuensis]|uniref:WD40 repeat domain-containing protein n=1 Tax=Streptomyces yangpuensis TaxID=1648182 RepID=A0ABY5Q4D9_9ACTN|nr:hypothetical protein [Streptomyces yangpuensis]UUY51139.1 hypothetical protein NRK68_30270 [Streptomyces yangpuensis]